MGLHLLSVLYIIINLFDVVLTYHLVWHDGQTNHYLELNPIARWVIFWTGVLGMIIFKFINVFGALFIVYYVDYKKPESTFIKIISPKVIVAFGCLYVGAAVVYSSSFFL